MVSTFGELVYESSRAFADDEEEEFQNQTGLRYLVRSNISNFSSDNEIIKLFWIVFHLLVLR